MDIEDQTVEHTVELEERKTPASLDIPDSEPLSHVSTGAEEFSREGLSTPAPYDTSSPQEAMRREDIRRMRFVTIFSAGLAIIACGLALLLPGDALARDLHVAGAAVTALAGIAMALILRDETRYRVWMTTLFGLIASAATSAGFYFWGVNSAIILVIPIGTFFFALGESYWGAVAIHSLAATMHGAITIMQILGVIPRVGLIKAETLEDSHRWGILLALQVIYLGSFLMARALRRSSHESLERLSAAVRDIAQREALLEEAKEDLARALKVGGPGRFTGQQLGHYKLGVILGRGGMGDVYSATHEESGELAAVKVLNRDGLTDSAMVARFYRELEITRSIQEEHVVRVLDYPKPDAPMPYLAMEKLNGKTLGQVLRAKPKMSTKQMLRLMEALTRGMGAAHKLGIVHRDLKPKNLIAHQAEGKTTWKILDFGVSKLADHSGTLTQGHVVGTPSYMSPQQAAGEEVDARADLYSIGVILYRVMTGRRAFLGTSIPALLRAVHSDMPPKPSDVADLSHAMDCVLAVAMAKKPDDRFATAEELATAVREAAKGKLSAATQERGEALMERYPWGAEAVF